MFKISRNWLTPEGQSPQSHQGPKTPKHQNTDLKATGHVLHVALVGRPQSSLHGPGPNALHRPPQRQQDASLLRGCPPPLLTNGARPSLWQPPSHPALCFHEGSRFGACPPCCGCSHNKDKAGREAFLLSSSTRCDKRLSKHHLMWPALQNPHPSPESLWPLI